MSSLLQLMSRDRKQFSVAEVKRLMIQLLDAMAYLHSHYIVHRDLKMSNLLYSHSGQVKIADFGLARTIGSPRHKKKLTPRVITLWYRAPELLLGAKTYSFAVDMWSLGCILGELLACEPMFRGSTRRRKWH